MTLLQAFKHFVVEAGLNMIRSWRVSLLAVLVTAVSLFLGGAFFLLGRNLDRSLASWQAQARVVVYMVPGASGEALADAQQGIERLPGVIDWQLVNPKEAERRLRERSPELSELIGDLDEEPLPASFEIEVGRWSGSNPGFEGGLDTLRTMPEVDAVDDDRAWIEQIAFAALVLRAAAGVIGLLLICGSVFIIASVIRLAALLHREEIRVQRLVGATEFFVRGPFVVQGLLQGVLGCVAALLCLDGVFLLVARRELPELLRSLLLSSFLSPVELAVLVAIGTTAGLVGGLLSVRRTATGMW